jgi:predicted DsbA family dithiol-disulfide isomerase
MFDNLRRSGKDFGIVFGDRTLLSNSRLSLEASEYARDMGLYDQFHDRIFHAYFTEAFIINDTHKIVGAQPVAVFIEILNKIGKDIR